MKTEPLISNKEVEEINNKNKQLAKQSFETLKGEISPLTPEIMSRQATINIGTIGHVSHGKTTVVRAISGVHTIRSKKEKERNATWDLGYANAKLYKLEGSDSNSSYKSFGSDKEDIVTTKEGKLELQRHVSFVDCPGHDSLMATMLNGAAVMDAALLLIAANEHCPQSQTKEHLAAVESMNLKNIIILQNKIDTIMKDTSDPRARNQYNTIKSFIKSTCAEKSPIIPISAQFQYNIDVVIKTLCKIPMPIRDFTSPPKFIIVRSFDVNRPGFEPSELSGGVAGGTLIRGVLRVGDEVEIRPGIVKRNKNDEFYSNPLFTTIVSLKAEKNELVYAVPGGLIGIGTKLDPFLTVKNLLVGRILGLPNQLPGIFNYIEVKVYLLKRLLGVKSKMGGKTDTNTVTEIKFKETLLLNVGSTSIGGYVNNISSNKERVTFRLTAPVCAEEAEKIAISRHMNGSYRLIGWGNIHRGFNVEK